MRAGVGEGGREGGWGKGEKKERRVGHCRVIIFIAQQHGHMVKIASEAWLVHHAQLCGCEDWTVQLQRQCSAMAAG